MERAAELLSGPRISLHPAVLYTTPAIPVSIGWLTKSRGSVILPVNALAATVRGLAR